MYVNAFSGYTLGQPLARFQGCPKVLILAKPGRAKTIRLLTVYQLSFKLLDKNNTWPFNHQVIHLLFEKIIGRLIGDENNH